MVPSRLTLGTAQFGRHYGINNKIGRPSEQACHEILDFAYDNGIHSFDTAQAYGDSDRILGNWIARRRPARLVITTKLSSMKSRGIGKNELAAHLEKNIRTSIKRLRVPVIDYLLLHQYEDVLHYGAGLIEALGRLKEAGLVRNIGFSVYEPQEAKQLLPYRFDAIQVPASLFDRRFLADPVMGQLKNNRVMVFGRSVFLQGLLLMDPSDVPPELAGIKPHLAALEQWADKLNVTKQSVALGFVNQVGALDSVLIGVDSVAQLRENLEADRIGRQVDLRFLSDVFVGMPESLIDPRRWGCV